MKAFKLFLFMLVSLVTYSATQVQAAPVQTLKTDTMKYITVDEFKAHVGESFYLDNLTDQDGILQVSLLDEVNKQAYSEMDSYLRGAYDLDGIKQDLLLTTLCGDIMKYRLYKRRNEQQDIENIYTSYKDAIKTLEKIQSNKIQLALNKPEDKASETQHERIRFSATKQLFGNGFSGTNSM